MTNSLSKKYSFFSLLKFAFPNMIMMIFLSLYTVVDGMFVSKFVGTTALSAINMVFPVICVELGVAIMLASGGSAIIAKKFGEKKSNEANNNFTFIISVVIIVALVFMILGNIFINDIIRVLGASEQQFTFCKTYLSIFLLFAIPYFLQTAFQVFFVTAGKPIYGLILTVLAGITNICLDYLFIVNFGMGIAGAALGTGIGSCIPATIGIIYFIRKNHTLHFTKPVFDAKVLLKTCTNGSSEMVTNIANAVTTFLFNYSFMKFYGEDGVASITIVLYFEFVFTAIYFGYSMGIAPIISYKYGAKESNQIKSIFKYSLLFLSITSVITFVGSLLIVGNVLTFFTDYGTNVYTITLLGFPLYAICFLFMGFNIFSSSMFTAFSDGKTSATISFSRTFLFLSLSILLLPLVFSNIGIWIATPVAEILGIILSAFFIFKKRKKFNYI